MRKYLNVDVVEVLGAITEVNTATYKSDFRRDVQVFNKAAREGSKEDGIYYWMSRKNGTVLCEEREAMIKGSYANTQWVGYAEFPRYDNYLAYAVEITGKNGGRAMGNLYEIDYVAMGEFLAENALPFESVLLDKDTEKERRVHNEDYTLLNAFELKNKYGNYDNINFEVSDENKDVLDARIAKFRDYIDRDGLTESEFVLKVDAEYLRKLEIGTAEYDFPGDSEDGITRVSTDTFPGVHDYYVIDAVYYSDGIGFGFGETGADGENKYCVWKTDAETAESEFPKSLYSSGDAYAAAGEYVLAASVHARGIDEIDYVTKITKTEFENYLKNAEMSLEDDYGMIDGIINNGKREEPTEYKELLDRLANMNAQITASLHGSASREIGAITVVNTANYLNDAEMSLENDYGMTDDIINNGKREEPAEDRKKALFERLANVKAQIQDSLHGPEYGGAHREPTIKSAGKER